MPQNSTFMQNLMAFDKPDGFNQYALGAKHYGIMGSPQRGTMNPDGMRGYAQRDMETRARKKAVLDRMQAMNSGAYGSSAALRSY